MPGAARTAANAAEKLLRVVADVSAKAASTNALKKNFLALGSDHGRKQPTTRGVQFAKKGATFIIIISFNLF